MPLIKISRAASPAYLSLIKSAELTSAFISTGASVWNHDDIKDPLLKSSFGKCAYCEVNLSEESKYMEVEHFEDKENNKNKVVDWDNLLPSCKRCNGSKGTHDVINDPIINPFDTDPKKHLGFRCYRFKKLSDLGKSTIDVVDLNNSDRVVLKRFEVGEAILKSVRNACERYDRWSTSQKTRSKNLLISQVDGLLLECQKEAAYAATAATVLHSDDDYNDLVSRMTASGLWNDDLAEMHNSSKLLALSIV